MRLRAERDVLRHVTQLPEGPNVALSLNGDDLEVEYRFTVRRTLRVAGLGPGLAVMDADVLAEVLASLEPGAVELEVDGQDLVVRAGRDEHRLRCRYTRDRP